MLEKLNYNLVNSDVTRADSKPRVNLPIEDDKADQATIQLIDLDNPRGQIKPTTWHR